MAYDTVKVGIANLLKGLGYQESEEASNFADASSNEYGNTFILNCLSGAMDEEDSETIVDQFYDVQEWQAQIAFDKSANSDVINRDDMHRKKDTILTTLDKPINWSSFVRILKYNTWNIQATENYYLLTINLKIVDTYIY